MKKKKTKVPFKRTYATDVAILEFLGYTYATGSHSDREVTKGDKYHPYSYYCPSGKGQCIHLKDIKLEWNGIMLLIEKIEVLGFAMHTHKTPWNKYNCIINHNGEKYPETVCIGNSDTSRLEAIYEAVILFIEWHNKHVKE